MFLLKRKRSLKIRPFIREKIKILNTYKVKVKLKETNIARDIEGLEGDATGLAGRIRLCFPTA